VRGFSQSVLRYDAADQMAEVAVEMQPGDCVIHHCNVLHRADPNLSATSERRAVACVYQAKSCEIDWAHKEYMAKQIQEQGFDGGTAPSKANVTE
jgi:hypothetical protein